MNWKKEFPVDIPYKKREQNTQMLQRKLLVNSVFDTAMSRAFQDYAARFQNLGTGLKVTLFSCLS